MTERVELHLHTTASEDVSVITPKEVIETAVKLGHKAVAVTCCNSAQDFPELEACQRKYGKDIKVIYGAEVYYLKDDTACGMTLLAKNAEGLKGLYRVLSSLRKWGNRKVADWQVIAENRGNLLCGGMTWVASELAGPLDELQYDDLKRFDYIAIAPLEYPTASGQARHRQLYAITKKNHIPVVAVGNCHYITPEDAVCREVIDRIRYGCDEDTLTHFRTTGEMLQEFSYLGEEAAYEVAVTNPNLIADQTEWVYPTAGKFPPFTLPNAHEGLKRLCAQRLQLLYPGNLPGAVKARLAEEVEMLEKADIASLYMLAHHIASYLRRKGEYLCARGSLGSSMAAYLLEISDTNPLPAHYHCPRCGYADFDVDAISGYDLPAKTCPCCGADMRGDGHNIPYETEMGLAAGDWKPAIALNTPGELRQEILRFVTEFLGKDRVAYAGSVGRISNFLAHAYIHVYRDAYAEIKPAEDDRIAKKLCGIKNSEGKHPGGIMLLPEGMAFEDVTPVRKLDEPWYGIDQVTHMDYHSIETALPKIDILSGTENDRLTRLFELTGTKPEDIDLGDPKVYAMLCDLDTLGITEFSTKFTRKLIQKIQPRTFSDLVKMSGMSHGINVWCDNGENLLPEHPFCELIGDRDDIFLTLRKYGVDRETAYTVMETVRRGRFRMENPKNCLLLQKLLDAKVPQWYLESMQKIRYLFSKAHTATYTKQAVSLTWFKIYYPEQFYNVSLQVLGAEKFMRCSDAELNEKLKTFEESGYIKDREPEAIELLKEARHRNIPIDFSNSVERSRISAVNILFQ